MQSEWVRDIGAWRLEAFVCVVDGGHVGLAKATRRGADHAPTERFRHGPHAAPGAALAAVARQAEAAIYRLIVEEAIGCTRLQP